MTLVAAVLIYTTLLSAVGTLVGLTAMVSMVKSGDAYSAVVMALPTSLNSFLLGLALHGWWQ